MAFASRKRQPTKPFCGVEFAIRGAGLIGLEREMGYKNERNERRLRTVSQGSDLQVPL
jgi:hypothetical protein